MELDKMYCKHEYLERIMQISTPIIGIVGNLVYTCSIYYIMVFHKNKTLSGFTYSNEHN